MQATTTYSARWLLLGALIFTLACSPSRVVRPLPEGQTVLSGHFGGPVVEFGGLITPLPLTSLGVAHGVTDKLSLYGYWHSTAASFAVVQLELGGTYGWLEPQGWRPGFSSSLSLNPMIELRPEKAHEEPRTRFWLPGLQIGHQWQGKRFDYQLELKWLAPGTPSDSTVVNYIGPANQGTLGLYFGLGYRF